MEEFCLMTEPEPIDPKIIVALEEKFHVYRKTCEHFDKYYSENILPRIQKKYLAHLIASIEEIIDEKIKEDRKKKHPEETTDKKVRDFSIVLTLEEILPPGKKHAVAMVYHDPDNLYDGVNILYQPHDDPRMLRIFIAHELGHVLREYNIIGGSDTENHANLFAYLAISGKNKFYKGKAKDLIYESEEQIINSISDACPIDEFYQVKDLPLKKD